MNKIVRYRDLIEKALSGIILDRKPDRLYQPISYTLKLGGKRLRPILTLMACELFGGNINEAINPALGLEIFHNFTLLHDDIMDEAPLRRGHVTVWQKWDPNVAILSGDTMFALAYKYVSLVKSKNLPEILDTLTQTAIEVCEGQQYDMDFEIRDDVMISEYLEMIRLKTAVLLGASVKIGALIANANNSNTRLIYDFGVNAGIAFQLKDDWLDAFGNPEKFGKNIGGDIRANKKTYLYLKCLEKADNSDRQILVKLFHDKSKSAKKVDDVLKLYAKYCIRQETIDEMEYFFGKSLDLLEQINAPRNLKNEIIEFAEWLYKRDH
nr:polyprenyl synthetase family protein [Bacteroidota bacterium]